MGVVPVQGRLPGRVPAPGGPRHAPPGLDPPGLGDGVDKPAWRNQWVGKQLFDADGNPQIEVVKGPAPDGSDYQIDGLAGATLTGRGVSNFVRYWIGEEGYGPYLKELGQKERQ